MCKGPIQQWIKEFAAIYIFVLCSNSVFGDVPLPLSSYMSHDSLKMPSKNEIIPLCKVCHSLVDSFKKGMENTARGKYEGGDAYWEESRLGSYSNSEVRLVEIQEMLCSDVSASQNQCHNLAEEHESLLEEWWFKKKKEGVDLFQFFCINKVQLCCPKNHYGPLCEPCSGDLEKVCNGHGICQGDGTRQGSGKCICDSGYKGDLCNECAEGYHPENGEEEQVCVACHRSCKGYCRGPGSQGCEVCAIGYRHEPEPGCIDINECIESANSLCEHNEFCVNTEGSFSCEGCDPSCNGCSGAGSDKCIQCEDSYTMENGKCIYIKEVDESKEESSSEEILEEKSDSTIEKVINSHTEL